MLTKLIVDPIHWDPVTRTLSPTTFKDVYLSDLSLFREDLATDEEIQLAINEIKATGMGKAPPQQRAIVAVAMARASDITALRLENPDQRACYLYDTGEQNKPAHASAFTPSRVKAKNADQKRVRRKLLELFNQTVLPAEDYRQLLF